MQPCRVGSFCSYLHLITPKTNIFPNYNRLISAKTPGRLLSTLPVNITVDAGLNAANLATAMLSNVPGPQQQCHLAGKPLDNMEFFLFSGVGLYFGIFSYNGKVTATANADKKTGADPHKLVNLFVPAFEEIYRDVVKKVAEGGGDAAAAVTTQPTV